MIYKCFICDKKYPTELKTIKWISERKEWFCNDCADVDNELKIVEKNGKIKRSGLSDLNNK